MTPTPKKLKSREWLINMYVDQRKTCAEIAEIIGCNSSTVSRALKRHGIPINKPISKYPLLNNKRWLIDTYINQGKSTTEISNIVGCTEGLVYDMLRRLGVSTRNWSDAQLLRAKREEHGTNWKGGRIKYGEYIAVYDPSHPRAMKNGYVPEHRLVMEKILGRYLEPFEVVHHIDGDKRNNCAENLVVVTKSRHAMTHKDTLLYVAELESNIREYEELYGRLPEKNNGLDS